MAGTVESTFATRDGIQLYTKTWVPESPSSRHLIFVHGFSDHINAYYDLFPTLSSSLYNITVHAFDQRGWGRSVHKQSDWGLTGNTYQVLCDLHDFIAHVGSSITSHGTTPKLFLMGHSMGGAESLLYTLSDNDSFRSKTSESQIQISGLLLESPFVALPPESAPSRLTVMLGRLTAMIMPNMQMIQKLDAKYMCRNPQVCKDWAEDTLCHDTGTLRGLAGMLDRASDLDNFGSHGSVGLKRALPCPVWWAHGTSDKVTDYSASKRLYEKLAAASEFRANKFVSLDGGYHKLHGEPDGMAEEFARGAGEWILEIAPDSDQKDVNRSRIEGTASEATAGTLTEGSDSVKSRL